MTSTDSTTAARAHARAQAAAAALPEPELPAGIDPAQVVLRDRIPAGGYLTRVLARGTRIRLTDPTGAACAHLLLFRAEAPWERLNVADTLKVPWQAYLGTGHPLLSDQGRVLATVLTDTSGHHDALCGPTPEVRHALRLGAAKHGLAPADVGPTLSFFRGVRVDADGGLTGTGSAAPGAALDLIAHLPVTLLLASGAHPLDERPAAEFDVVAWAAPDDLALRPNPDPEYLRAVDNTEAAWKAAHLEGVPA